MNVSRAAWLRIAPFVAFLAILALRGAAPADGRWGFDTRWLYALNLLLVGGLLLAWRREYGELAWVNRPTWAEAALAIVTGLLVFALWITLTAPWMQIGEPTAGFVPVDAQGRLEWPLIASRWLGASLLVPVMEELFWRSFVMRWIERPVFEGVDPRRVGVKAVLLSTFLFVLVHTLWLGAAIAHAVTNGALGIYVVSSGRWMFW